MDLPEGIEHFRLSEFENKHQNYKQSFTEDSFYLVNPFPEKTPWQQYKLTTKNFQWLINWAIQKKVSLRAMGRGWSFSKVAVANGAIVETRGLRNHFKISKTNSHPTIANSPRRENLILTQCGMSIYALNRILEREKRPRKSIRASGGSNGQTIVGAFSTNTHGGAINFGAVHDQIVGLHVISRADKHYWIERKSDPITSSRFVRELGAELIREDDLFNSALISFGSFGFIHGVMVEAEDIFLLNECTKANVKYNKKFKDALDNNNLDSIADSIPGSYAENKSNLYHLEFGLNPHQFKINSRKNDLFIRTMYKEPYRSYPPFEVSSVPYGENTFGIIQSALDIMGDKLSEKLIPSLVNTLFPLAYKERESKIGTIGEHFGKTRIKGKAASFALGVSIQNCTAIIDIITKRNESDAFPGVVALRFLKGTPATLGLNRFNTSCIIELDAMESKKTREFYSLIVDDIISANIEYTIHWGKLNFMLNKTMVRSMYGTRLDTWKDARNKLMNEESQFVFTNEFMIRCGFTPDLLA